MYTCMYFEEVESRSVVRQREQKIEGDRSIVFRLRVKTRGSSRNEAEESLEKDRSNDH